MRIIALQTFRYCKWFYSETQINKEPKHEQLKRRFLLTFQVSEKLESRGDSRTPFPMGGTYVSSLLCSRMLVCSSFLSRRPLEQDNLTSQGICAPMLRNAGCFCQPTSFFHADLVQNSILPVRTGTLRSELQL